MISLYDDIHKIREILFSFYTNKHLLCKPKKYILRSIAYISTEKSYHILINKTKS